MERIEMLKLEDGDYVPKECCTINRCLEVDDVDLPCGADWRKQCSNCIIQKIMNAYGEALEKQIPERPVDKTRADDTASRARENCHIIVCPRCRGRLKLKSKGKYCDKCGQALDWGEENTSYCTFGIEEEYEESKDKP